MANVYDQFDAPAAASAAGAGSGGNVYDQFDEPSGVRDVVRRNVIDVAKQIPSGLVTGTEAIAAFPAQAAGMLAPYANRILPSFLQGDPEAEQRQAELRALTAAQRGEGIAQYLPKPQTTAGQFARTAAEFVPATVAGTPGLSIPRAIGAGATAGLASEAAGQATEGTGAEPVARIGGALVGGTVALRQAERAAARAAVPSIEQLKERAGQLYDRLRASGLEIEPAAASSWGARVKADLTQAGLDDNIAPKTWGIVNKLDNAPAGATMTAQNFQSLRRTLGNAAGSIEPSERLAAAQAKNQLDDFLARLSPTDVRRGNPQQASALLGEANANYAAAERAAAVDKRITAAELQASATHSGLNVENQIRQQMAQVLKNPALQRGYSSAELAEMKRIVSGSNIGNVGRWAGKFLGGGGGLGALATTGAGYLTGDTSGAIAAPLTGLALVLAGNRATAARARALEQMARARSPLAAQTAAPRPAGAAPFALLPPAGRSLAELGQE